MNNKMTILFSLLILSALTESKPRHKHKRKYETQWSQESEEQNENANNRRSNRMGPRPAFNSNTNNNLDNSDLDSEVITSNLPYPRPFQPNSERSNGGNSFDDYGSGGSGGTYNQRPFRPVSGGSNRMPYNDFQTNYNGQRSYEIGDLGNGHHNTNTFNIHKKIIYIS